MKRNLLEPLIDLSNTHPRSIAWLGTVSGWFSVDMLRATQIFYAATAGLVSLCALILTAPQAYQKIKQLLKK
jgi:hypothetical protein